MTSQSLRAFCFPSGLIEFGHSVPRGAIVIARGPERDLRDYISAKARHGYLSSSIGGRRRAVPGSEQLLVPGIPEADNQVVAMAALARWASWIAVNAPKSVRVLPR